MYYYLLDLERTIGLGIAMYWKQNRHGYTEHIKKAGLFPQDIAEAIVAQDHDKRTIMIEESVARKISEI